MTDINLYNFDHVYAADIVDIPAWIERDITCNDIAAIIEGGCDSGAYVPAVTYHKALATMNDYGGAVLQFIADYLGSLPPAPEDVDWSGLACYHLSCAVELWAGSVVDELTRYCEELESDEEEEE